MEVAEHVGDEQQAAVAGAVECRVGEVGGDALLGVEYVGAR